MRGLLDDKQQEIEALQCRLANSQAHLQLKEHSRDGTLTCLQETQHELADSEGRLQVSRHELSDAQERLEVMHDFLHGPAPLVSTHLNNEIMTSALTA